MKSTFQAALVVALLAPGLAVAGTSKPPAKAAPLNKEALKACVALEAGMAQKINAYNAEVRASNERLDRAKAMRSELDTMLAAVRDGKAEMAEYNAKVDAFNAFVQDQEDKRVVLSEISVEHDRLASEFNAKCAGRRFQNADLVDLKRRR